MNVDQIHKAILNNLKQLKYFGMFATNLISIFSKKLNPGFIAFD